MSSRIDVELTSERPDGTWTWRAAGARQPKGVLDGSLLPEKTKVGDVIRAEADFDVDGITVTAVLPPRSTRREPQRIEILGPPPEERPPAGRADPTRHPKGRGPERPRPPRPADGDRRRPDRDGERRRRPDQRPSRRDTVTQAPSAPARPKPKKLRPGRAHRDAVLAELPPEQHPIAVQVLRGGIPAVRTALEEQNAKARKEGLPEAPNNAVLAIAERLLPRLRVAEWLDRAEAALADADDLALRDLRSVVVSADDVARDPSTREAAARLREILERRTTAEHQEWLADLCGSLESGRVVRALRLSSRPPQPGDHLPPEVITRLAEAAGAAMTADAGPERWATVLDAVAYSAVRRNVTPAGVPSEPGEELLALVRKHAGRVPGIAQLFGVEPTTERSGPKRRGSSADRAPKHRGRQQSEPPSKEGGPATRPRRIPPPPASEAPVAGSPVAEPAPPTTSPADPPAGAAVPPAGVAPATEAPTTEPSGDAPATESPAAPDAAATEWPAPDGATPEPVAEPVGEPAPDQPPPASATAVDPLTRRDRSDPDGPAPPTST
ncbi:MAG TPA: hypothetical protein VGV63_07260 [Acidimicrobiales bacterium]|nr:hypothetical protein [Acidimicrobiales bacterium]